ncbi:MAG: BatD family protein [Bdellovibrionota bacterium]
MRYKSYLSYICMLWTVFSYQNLMAGSFSAELDKTSAALGESLGLEVHVEGELEGQDIYLPEVKGLQIESTGTSQSTTVINGKVSSERIYSFTIIPISVGSYEIPSLKAKIDGQMMATLPLRFQVNKDPSQGQLSGSKDIFIEREVSKASAVYVGEPFVLTIRAYVKSGMRLSSLQSLTDRSTVLRELDKKDFRPYEKKVGDSIYTVSTTKIIAVPLAASENIFPEERWKAIYLKPETKARQRRHSFFDDFFSMNQWQKYSLLAVSDALSFKALEVPKASRPANYGGIVGEFTISAELSKSELAMGDTATLTVRVKGNGLLELLKAPELDFSNAVKVYTDQGTNNQDLQIDSGVLSEKVFKYALVPAVAGEVDLQSISIPVFNPSKHSFENLSVDLGKLKVSGSNQEQAVVVSPNSGGIDLAKKSDIKQLAHDLIDIHRRFDLHEAAELNKSDLEVLSLMTGGPLALLLFTFFFQSYRSRFGRDQAKRRRSHAFKNLKQSSHKLDGMSLSEFYKNFRIFVGDKASVKGEALTKQDLILLLVKMGISQPLIDKVILMADKVQQFEYTDKPIAEAVIQQTKEEILQIAKEIDKQC